MADIDIHNFKVVKFGDPDSERNYINDVLHAIVSETDNLQTQIDNAGGGGSAPASTVTAQPEGGTSRVLTGQTGVINIQDNGPGNAVVVGVTDGGIGATQLGVTGTPSATTVIKDDGTILSYVEVVDSLNSQTGDINLTSSDSSITIDATVPGTIDLKAVGGGSGVTSVTDDGNFLVSVDNTNPATPVITLDKITADTFVANATGSSAVPTAISGHTATGLLDVFAGAGTPGIVPDPGSLTGPVGYTLRADGTWHPTSSGAVVSITAGTGITVDNTIPSAPVVSQANTAVTPATYGDSSHYPTFTVDQQGNLTAASQIALPAASTGANPTASVGLTTVNGSATTFMRSDAAPALSQAISPTWSGNHTFNNSISASNGMVVAASGVDIQGGDLFTESGNVKGGSLGHVRSVGGWTTYSGTQQFYCGITGDADPPTIGRIFVSDGSTGSKIDALQLAVGTADVTVPHGFAINGVVTPTALSGTGTTNNWAPGVDHLTAIRQQLTGINPVRIITGLSGGSDGKIVIINNISTTLAAQIVLSAEDSGSTAANRFGFSADVILNNEDAVALWYDNASSRWRLLQIQPRGFQSSIQIQDEGSNQGTAGQATTYNFVGGGVTASVSSSTATITIPSGESSVIPFFYGDGSDGSFTFDGTTTPSWATRSGSSYTLTRDVAAVNWTFNSGTSLALNNFRVLGTGILDCSAAVNPCITNHGTAGGSSTGTAGGSAGSTISTTGPLGAAGIAGAGATGGAANGAQGTSGAANSQAANNGGANGASGQGGNGGAGTGPAGRGQVSPTKFLFPRPDYTVYVATSAATGTLKGPGGGIGGSGGSSGGGNTTVNGGGGGGGGGAGGAAWIAFRTIVLYNGTLVNCSGQSGGNGSIAVGATNCGGGGGGSGGGGGWIIFTYSFTSGSGTLLLDASGGAGGNGSVGNGTGTAGQGGNGGDGGRIQVFNLGTGIPTSIDGTGTGGAHSGTTGGAAGSLTFTIT